MRIALKKVTSLLTYGLMVAMLLFGNTLIKLTPAYAAAGDSEDNPAIIATCEDLQAIDSNAANYSKHYALESDIDCTGSNSWDSGKGFNPIASNSTPFTGSFNGNHYSISNLTINRANDTPGSQAGDEQSVGLFAWTQSAEIYDLNVDTSKVKGYEYVGGIVGWAETTTFTNVSFNTTVADNSCDPGNCVWARYGHAGGGIAGMFQSGTMTNAVSGGPVKGSGNTIGGLVGTIGSNATITSSSSTSNVDGGHHIGGAVGNMLGGSLVDVHVTGGVEVNDIEDYKDGYAAGGLVGAMESTASITRSSATGDVHADYGAAGGLVGRKEGAGSITDSYASGAVTQGGSAMAGGWVGGLVGEFHDGTVERVYASGSATGSHSVGGLMGLAYNGSIQDSFSAGPVTTTIDEEEDFDGGFIGRYFDDVELDNNYYDAGRTGMDHCLASYPEGYSESPATISGECTAVNQDHGVPNYFYQPTSQPFYDGSVQRWGLDIWEIDSGYPQLDCAQCKVIRDGYQDTSVTVETHPATGVSQTSAVLNGEAQLHNDLTSEDLGESGVLLGFLVNTSSEVTWENNTRELLADWDTIEPIEGDDTNLSFSASLDGFECGTQYWFVALYGYGDGDELGVAENIETFTTNSCEPDADNDGISDEVENAAPNGGDANDDSIPDSEQPNVISYVNPVTGKYAVFETNCSSIENFQVGAESSENPDDKYDYPMGLTGFHIICEDEGATADIKQYYYGTEGDERYKVRKWNDQGYREIPGAVPLGQLIDNQVVFQVSYQITDGGEFDDDHTENGVIVDPSGVAIPASLQSANNAKSVLGSTGQNILVYIFVAAGTCGLATLALMYRQTRKLPR